MTTCDDATIGLAVGWPWTEMPYSTSVPITRRTLMRPAYGYDVAPTRDRAGAAYVVTESATLGDLDGGGDAERDEGDDDELLDHGGSSGM
ncbi:hypothetical protein GCM10009788_42750 [Nocardioides humi]|uniref:ATP-grasp target RiPP n=1 Tax=Nocardioides humi TaxID=449461 RepID=A0ABN2B9R0_9ACTN